MKKDRPDSFEAKLEKNQLETLERWLFDETPPLTYAQAKERVYQDFNLRVSESALRRFYARKSVVRLREETFERVVTRAETANAVVDECEKNPAPFQRAVLELVARIAMEKAAESDKKLSITELSDLCLMALAPRKEEREDKKVALTEERLKLDRQKLELEIKDKIALALDALYAEIKDKPEAVKLFNQFRAVVSKATSVVAPAA
jgi:hypothetical protein